MPSRCWETHSETPKPSEFSEATDRYSHDSDFLYSVPERFGNALQTPFHWRKFGRGNMRCDLMDTNKQRDLEIKLLPPP
jgi:hypothetical protein